MVESEKFSATNLILLNRTASVIYFKIKTKQTGAFNSI